MRLPPRTKALKPRLSRPPWAATSPSGGLRGRSTLAKQPHRLISPSIRAGLQVRAGVAPLPMSASTGQRVLRHYGPAADHDLKTAMKLMYALSLRELVLFHPSQRHGH